jgi:DNA-binding NarL/FixJ family response regulator
VGRSKSGPSDATSRRVASEKKSVVVLSQHAMCRRGVCEVLAGRGCHVIECTVVTQLSATTRHSPFAVIVDIDHADQDVATLLATVRELVPCARVVPLGTPLRQAAAIDSVDEVGIETNRADASAFTRLAHPRRASAEVTRLLRLWSRVTPRQRAVMANLAVGRDNRSIAHELGVGERAVKAHVSALLAMFNLDHRTELALLASGAGLQP